MVTSLLTAAVVAANALVVKQHLTVTWWSAGAGEPTPGSMAPYAGNNTGTVSRGNGVLLFFSMLGSSLEHAHQEMLGKDMWSCPM